MITAVGRRRARYAGGILLSLLIILAAAAPNLPAQGVPTAITDVESEANAEVVRLTLSGSGVLDFRVQAAMGVTTVVFSGVSVAEGVKMPQIASPLVVAATLNYDPVAGETRLVLIPAQGVRAIPFGSEDKKQVVVIMAAAGEGNDVSCQTACH